MEYSFYFPPEGLKECASNIAVTHLVENEVVCGALTDKAGQLTKRLQSVNLKELPKYALGLEGAWLEAVLIALQTEADESISQKLIEILRLRPKERLFNLCWQLLQDDCDNRSLINAMEVLCQYMKARHEDIYRLSLPAHLGGRFGMLSRYALRVMQEEGGSIRDFFKRYGIKESSVLGLELQGKFFSLCDAQGFVINQEMLQEFIKNGKSSWVRMTIANYLGMLDTDSYFDDFNQLLIEKIGSLEDTECCIWLDRHLIDRLHRWQMLYRIRSFYNDEPVVTHMWTGVNEKIRNVEGPDEAGMLMVSLEDFVLLCGFPGPHDGLLYRKALFQSRFRSGDLIAPNWAQLLPKDAPAARDAIIDGVRSDVYRLDFTGAGILFAGELLSKGDDSERWSLVNHPELK